MTRSVPEQYLKLLPVWGRIAWGLQKTVIGLGITATVCSLGVTAFSSYWQPLTITVVSFLSTAALGLLTAFNLISKANRARSAWRLLNAGTIAYAEQPEYTIQELHAQYLAGETLLGGIEYTASKPERPLAEALKKHESEGA
jgi:hypothetical protein